ncbi:branched-chain amino acid transport system ATP-binding protein [Rhizobium leguminosarum]|uniref:Branched-chain amino acid transport system ATP-binding protein n=1 Tax=Rhizobium leguminosarum TaxID=384 RepID=A0AAE2MGY9_RHILE|nr:MULTISPECIES: ABC transporter ATP-binding protein [Rhizobium]MBB4289126.1 branched-chain amino acid transport system ATP-binding protein [Rhizobium leguminosarum]MBB4294781.1 branched-chain amino acid transport system ATP-binding protein [Rhizobium leguminosarum]MBB4306174.1 branched-chain amino acid transport system ATP-binding protein [Rhizobium leguminosarum]MBB4418246.1 branched-chain amino acid transport system ATP-binding protein [Rhizobium leguminosarum]MBB4433091.1 branched-chain am
MTDALLELNGVVAGYGDTHIIRNVSLKVSKGERLAIVGRNGVGKTTMLATVMGQTRQHAGSIKLRGVPIDGLQAHERARRGIGIVPQTRDIFPSLSVEENLIAGMRNGSTLDEAYDLFPRLKERRFNGGHQLSGGEQQMLSIARALLGGPEIILLDEPLEGLAPVICEMLMGVFGDLADKGCTVVLVEQHIGPALSFADRVVALDQGRIVFEEKTAKLANNRAELERYIGLSAT